MYAWTHVDPSLSAQAQAGLVRAESGQFGEASAGEVRELRALLVASAYNIARLVGSVSEGQGPDGTVEIAMRVELFETLPVDERWQAAQTLHRTWEILSDNSGLGLPPPSVVTGIEPETAALPVAVTVAAIAVGGAAIAYLGYRTLDTIDRQLARHEANRALLQKHVAAERIIDMHLEAERAAGKTLPLSEPARTVLGQLGQLQDQVAPKPPTESTGSEWTTLAWGIAAAAVAAIALPHLMK